MIHYTLNTGHTVESPRSGVADSALDQVVGLLPRGGPLPAPFSAFRVDLTLAPGGAVFSVFRARDPLATCGVAWTKIGADEVWPAVEELYLNLGDRPELVSPGALAQRPGQLPWLAVVLLPGLLTTARQDVGWLADFERCFAWAIVEKEGE